MNSDSPNEQPDGLEKPDADEKSVAPAASTAAASSSRVTGLRKLEKKESCGDLQSRLKTRKLLGVGETEDGDVHRSKLSQILGHSDQLHLRLPWPVRAYQLTVAAALAGFGVTACIKPELAFGAAGEAGLVARLCGGGSITVAFVLWLAWRSEDREVAWLSLAAASAHCTLQLLVPFCSAALDAASPHLPALRQSLWLVGHGAAAAGALLCLRSGCQSPRRHLQRLPPQQQQQQLEQQLWPDSQLVTEETHESFKKQQ